MREKAAETGQAHGADHLIVVEGVADRNKLRFLERGTGVDDEWRLLPRQAAIRRAECLAGHTTFMQLRANAQ